MRLPGVSQVQPIGRNPLGSFLTALNSSDGRSECRLAWDRGMGSELEGFALVNRGRCEMHTYPDVLGI